MERLAESKLALVTGASGGLGAALAVTLARRGWHVIAGSRSARLPICEGGTVGRIEAMRLDVTEEASIRAAIDTIASRGLAIELLLNNAGINLSGLFEELPRSQGREIIDTNFFGVTDMIRASLPMMRARGKGTILTIGSLAGLVAPPGEAYYAASKHALEGFLEALRYEVAHFGVRLCLAEPGFIATNLAKSAASVEGRIDAYDAMRGEIASRWQRAIANGVPADRMAEQVIEWALNGRGFRKRFGRDAVWVVRLKRLMPEGTFFARAARRFGIGVSD